MSAEKLTVAVQVLPHAKDLPLPAYATAHSAGMDLLAAVTMPVTLPPRGRAAIPTGLCIAVPPGWEAQVRARSGLALKHGISVANGVGTIDADYRGEVGMLLVNLSDTPFVIERGMRVAQMVFARHGAAAWQLVDTLDETARGAGGFGSTGVGVPAG